MSNKLPSEYQELEYIECVGEQYIRTNFKPNQDTSIKILTKITNLSSNSAFYCCRDSYNATSNAYCCFRMGKNLRHDYGNKVSKNYNFSLDTLYEIYSNKNKLYINNVLINETTYKEISLMYNMILFASHSNGETSEISNTYKGKIYECIIWDNDKLVRNFIPCIKKDNNKIGMYDLVNNVFYTNAGSGEFIAGPEVFDKSIKIVKPEVNWADSMEQTFEYYEVDPVSWKDTKPLDMVKKSTIKRDDSADTLGSATIDINDTLGECYIRIYLIIRQNGAKFKITLGTFLVQTPSSSYDGKNRNVSMDAYTPLLELKENPPSLGFALLKNENIMRQAYLLVRDNCRAPVVETTSDKTLQDNFVADPSEKWLNYINDLIAQVKYRLYLDEEGRILFAPVQKIDELQPVWTYNDDNSSILYPEVSMQHDLYGIPNVVEVVCSTGVREYTARVVNDDPNSPTSTVNRGREILHRDTEPNLPGFPTEEQIDEYAKHLLETLSSVEYQISYTHGYCPVRVGDAVRLNYKKAGLDNIKAKVISQSIKCENGCSVSETAVFTKKLWN